MTETPPDLERPPAPGLARRVGLSMAWSQASKVIEVTLTFGIAVLAVRALHPDRFGAYSLLTNLAGAASVFLPVVTMEALGALLPRLPRREQRMYMLLLIAGLRAAAILVASAVVISVWTEIAPHVGLGGVSRTTAAIAAAYWLSQDTLNTIVAYRGATIDMRPVVVWRGIGLAATATALASLVATDAVTVASVIAVVAAGYAIAAGGLAFSLRTHERPLSPGRERIRFALGLTRSTWTIGLLGFVLATQIDILLIGGLTHDRREAAYYAAAVGVIGRAQYLLVTGWSSLIIPAFSHTFVEGGDAALRRAWKAAAQLSLLVSVPIGALLVANAVPLIRLLFGADYAAAGGLLRWVSAFSLAAAYLVGSPNIGMLWVYDRQKTLARVRLVTAALNIAIAVPLIREKGALGAVLATGVVTVVGGAVEFGLARRIGSTTYPGRLAAVVTVASAVAMVPGFVIDPVSAVQLTASLLTGGTLFLIVLAIAKPFGADDVAAAHAVHPQLGRLLMRSFARP